MRYVKIVVIAVRFFVSECLVVSICLMAISAQTPVDNHREPPASNQDAEAAGAATQNSTNVSGSDAAGDSQLRRGNPLELVPPMRIGPGDDLEISVFGLPELTERLRVGNSGEVSLPLIGKLQLAGLSNDQAQAVIEARLADGDFVNNPHVSVYVKEYTTEGITLSGEVNKPGIYSALVGHRLVDLIQAAGGFTAKAGKTVTISHRSDPKHPIVVALSNDADTGQSNVELVPGDTVVVSKAGIIYMVGEVNRPGGFVIESNAITASQALALAAGPTPSAALNKSKVIRRTADGLQNIGLPLKEILGAKSPDLQLQPDDIVWVPGGRGKAGLASNSGYVLSLLTSLALYRF
jgi:polysaccharide biosynthesis/export protein